MRLQICLKLTGSQDLTPTEVQWITSNTCQKKISIIILLSGMKRTIILITCCTKSFVSSGRIATQYQFVVK